MQLLKKTYHNTDNKATQIMLVWEWTENGRKQNSQKSIVYEFGKLYWIVGRKSQLSLENKLLVYKAILKPIWTYGVQLWGTASNSNIDILERFQWRTQKFFSGGFNKFS
jgi:hypothetical protein